MRVDGLSPFPPARIASAPARTAASVDSVQLGQGEVAPEQAFRHAARTLSARGEVGSEGERVLSRLEASDSSDERDLAAVARACIGAVEDPVVSASFLSELGSGRTDAPSQRVARALLDASERGMSWEDYSSVLRVGLGALEADGPEGILLESARRALDVCDDPADRGRMGRSLMRMLTSPVSGSADAAVGRFITGASDEGMSWRNLAAACNAGFEVLAEQPAPDRSLLARVGRSAQSGGVDVVERARIGRAFMAANMAQGDMPATLHRAAVLAADSNLSWEGLETALQCACDTLRTSEQVSTLDRLALAGPWEGEQARPRCQARVDAMRALGPLTGIQEELERLQARPGSEGISLSTERLVVGGVRLKVRR